jgi:hypothetical protein
MSQTATMLIQAAITLDGLANTDQSKALDALSKAISELAAALTSVHTRYEPAGPALAAYSPALRTAMFAVDGAITESGSTDVGHAQRAEIRARAHEATVVANPFSSHNDLQQAAENVRQACAHTEYEHAVANHAELTYEQAMTALHTAAQAAAGQIEMGINDSHLNDGFSQYSKSIIKHLDNIISGPLQIVHEMLNGLSIALSLIGLALAFIPAVGEFVELLGSAVTVMDMKVETIRYEFGDITYGTYVSEMLLDVTGLLLTFVGGKAAEKLLGKKVEQDVAKRVLELLDEGGLHEAGDPIAGWVDSQSQGPPTLKTYLNSGTFQPVDFTGVDPDQIVEQSGVDVPGRIRVVVPQPTAPLQVAPPAQLPVQLRVYSSPAGG